MDKIFSPSYQGRHKYSRYRVMMFELNNFLWEPNELILNLDFLFPSEITHYLNDIFCPIFLAYRHDVASRCPFFIEIKDKTKFKEIRKIMKKHVIGYCPLIIKQKRFRLRIYV